MEEVKNRESMNVMYEQKRGDHRQNFRDISEAMPKYSNNDELTESTGTNTMSYRNEFASVPVI